MRLLLYAARQLRLQKLCRFTWDGVRSICLPHQSHWMRNFMQHTSNLLYAIHAVHQKPKPFQLPFSLYLKGPHDLSRRFQFNESHLAAGEKHNAVWHSIETGRYKFHCQPTMLFSFTHQSPINGSFSHFVHLISIVADCCCQRGPKLSRAYTRAYVSVSFLFHIVTTFNMITGNNGNKAGNRPTGRGLGRFR